MAGAAWRLFGALIDAPFDALIGPLIEVFAQELIRTLTASYELPYTFPTLPLSLTPYPNPSLLQGSSAPRQLSLENYPSPRTLKGQLTSSYSLFFSTRFLVNSIPHQKPALLSHVDNSSSALTKLDERRICNHQGDISTSCGSPAVCFVPAVSGIETRSHCILI
jgi:hypothetical protein